MSFVGSILLLAALLLPLAWAVRVFLREMRGERIPILCYHRFVRKQDVLSGRVADDEMGWVCYDDEFERQMDYLAEAGYTTLNLDELLEIQEGRRARPARPIAITMDDGYQSNYTQAFPVLRERGQKATIYVALEPDLHTRSQVEGIDGFLSPEELRELSSNGVSIQSHTLSHSILTELGDDEVRFELAESRRRLEEILGKPVEHFCFPRGGVDRRVRSLARNAGYKSATGAHQGAVSQASRAHDLPRINIDREMNLDAFRKALEPRHAAVIHLIGELKGMARRLVGPRRLREFRDLLHESPLRRLWSSVGLRRTAGVALSAYTVLSIAVVWSLFTKA